MNRRALGAIAVVGVLAAAVLGSLALRVGPFSPPSAGPAPRYVDETTASGLIHTYDGDLSNAVGGGLAVFDCNGDGKPDIYLAGGSNPAELFRNDSPTGGSLRFSAIHDPATDLPQVNGAYPVDIDSDGITDLVVLRNGLGNVLLRGLGECRFEDHTAAWGIEPGTRHTEAFSATWESGETWPTIAFGNYVDPSIKDPAAWCEPNELIRPKAGGHGFGQPVELDPSYCTLSMLFSDWGGGTDLRVSNDRDYYPQAVGREQLWQIPHDEPGPLPPREYTVADGFGLTQVQGMGIASYDLTGDGLPEIYLTSEDDSKLQTLSDPGTSSGALKPTYRNIGLDYGVNVTQPFTGPDVHLGSTAWQPIFDDVNNDGRIDLFVSKGNVKGQLDHAMADPSNLLLGQPDGTFKEAADAAGIVTFDKSRGAALADFNLDGRLDLVLAKYGAPVQIWRNAGPVCGDGCAAPAHWLAIRLQEGLWNLDAIGAVIEVQAGGVVSRREVTVGGGHVSGNLGWIHFGLGNATSAQVRVRWPTGKTDPWVAVPVDTFEIDSTTGAGGIQPWTPPG
ncbi:MAG TPA: CRTAC1 family protein [Candidatus Limnocylindrales bacterium]